MSIKIFDCDFDWKEVLTTLVPESNDIACHEIPLETYPINQIGRLLRITALSFYQVIPALQFVSIDYEAKRCLICQQYPNSQKVIEVLPEDLPYRYGKTFVR